MKNIFYDNYVNNDNNLMVSYKGPFFDEILGKLIEIIRENFSYDPVINRKLLAIFVELAQNVYHYSADIIKLGDKEYGIGCVNVSKEINNKYYVFTAGNFVPVEYVDDLVNICNTINSLDRDELRKLKRDTRSDQVSHNERSKGTGIGLIQIALTVNEPMEYEIIPHDDKKSFFYLTAKINN
jgi:hypothetical protein